MSDYTVFVKGRGTAYLGGPPLVKMAIDEIVDEETLGGAEMHSRISGLSDYLAVDELDALRIGRDIVAPPALAQARSRPDRARRRRRCTTRPSCSAARRPTCACRSTIREISPGCSTAAGSRSSSRSTATSSCAAGARSAGSPSACSATTGSCSRRRREKGAQFIQLCNRTDTPLVFLHNITGFMVGSKAEQGGIIRNGAKMINAVSNSTVPHFCLMVGASYGAGNYGMSGKAYDPRFIFTWPNHRIAVMGPKQLAGVMDIVARNAAAGRGVEVDEEALAAQTRRRSRRRSSRSRRRCTPRAASGTTGSSIPRDSRTVLGMALSAAHSNVVEGATEYGVWRH